MIVDGGRSSRGQDRDVQQGSAMAETSKAVGRAGGLAWAAFVLAGVCCIGVALVLTDLARAERGLPRIEWLDAVTGVLFEPLRVPLLVMILLAVVLGIAGVAGRRRESGLGRRRRLAAAGLVLGVVSLAGFQWSWHLLCTLTGRAFVGNELGQVGRALIRYYVPEHAGQYPPDLASTLDDPNIGHIHSLMLRCLRHSRDETHECYTYIASQGLADDPRNVLIYGKAGCLSDDAAHVLYVDGRVEWVRPYSRVLDLVEQTRTRLAARAAQSAPASGPVEERQR